MEVEQIEQEKEEVHIVAVAVEEVQEEERLL